MASTTWLGVHQARLPTKTKLMALRIERSRRREFTVFVLSGRLNAEYVSELEKLFGPPTDYSAIIVDLSDVRLADRAAATFLARCEESGITLESCPGYIREWITTANSQFNEEESKDPEEG
jgi:hypothetical protein